MKAVVVSSVPLDDVSLCGVMGALHSELEHAGFDEVERFELTGKKLGFCQGEFDCWLKHPGECKIHDEVRSIAAAIAGADAVIYAGRISFGGFNHRLKLAIDRLICLILPFFEERSELTHHAVRYARRPRMHAVGLLPAPDRAQAETFDALNDANAINLQAPGRSSIVLDETRPDLWMPSLRRMLEAPLLRPGGAITERESLRRELLAAARPALLPAFAPVRRAALLVGSAKPKGVSASEQLARAIAAELAEQGVEAELHYATEFVHDDAAALASARELAVADLFVLCSPLYVDALPALVVHALELVAEVRTTPREALFVPVIQCGFPEPEHTRAALRIARHFADHAGYHFAGALPLGAGGILTPERSLAEGKAPLHHIARAIRLAAPALAAGESIPEEALQEMLKPPIPDSLYRLAGDIGFRLRAYRNGTAQRELRRTPYARPDARTP